MKKDKIIYWATTVIVAAVMLISACYFAFNDNVKGAFTHLGLPGYFRIELSIAKVLGALAILIPGIPARIKEFAYAGLTIVLVSAIIAHLSSGDGIASLDPLFFLGMLVVSYLYYYKRYVAVKHS
ncbi:DoxX family protein [Chitinophaga oryziterrae]|uniref:DoxX family protein n=1 Tax=Chitinophaga oryziterrae TaxID=1031224 RepID=A0A6N8J946_9BACT|nr:DoxX family protein [Chitinophaga oryziterrae]MVT41805.1 DoxX family protein [Chitinophaga oryziterrae]